MASIVESINFCCFSFSKFASDWCPVILGKSGTFGFVCLTVVLGAIFYAICVNLPIWYVKSNVLLQLKGITASPGRGWGAVYQTCSAVV